MSLSYLTDIFFLDAKTNTKNSNGDNDNVDDDNNSDGDGNDDDDNFDDHIPLSDLATDNAKDHGNIKTKSIRIYDLP